MADERRGNRITRRALLAGGGAAVALAACSRGGSDDAARSRRRSSTTTAPTTSTTAPTTGTSAADASTPHRVLADGEHFADGFVVPAGETWALADGAQVTSAANIVVEGTLLLHQPDPARRMRLTFVDVDESAFHGEDTHEVLASDVGLWVVGSGRLDAQGAPKTSWTRLAAPAAAGDTSITVDDATGWRVGDEIAVTPTVGRDTDDYAAASDRAVITSVSGTTIGLDEALAHDHPTVDGRWNAEVINLTRSVVIEGTPDHKAHIMHLHQGMHAPADFRASSISYLELAHLGPNRLNDHDEPSSYVGRYAIHWHHADATTEGVVVEGAVAHDCGAHAFVAHSSNGITFRNCASHSTIGDPYWWDPYESSDYVTYDHCIASDVLPDGNERYSTSGFFAAQSEEAHSCAMRGCVAAGVQGPDSGGFFWDNNSVGVWAFEDCLAHNIEHNGIRVWQNASLVHPIDRFTAYNCAVGISHGAYANAYQYHEAELYGCGTGVLVTAVTAAEDGSNMEFHDVTVTGADTALVLEDAPVDASGPVDFRRCRFDSVRVNATHEDSSKQWDLVDCGVTPDDIAVDEMAGEALLRVQVDGEAWETAAPDDWSTAAPL